MPPVTTRIFPSAENPLIPRSRALRFAEPCPRSLSDGFRAAYPLAPASKDEVRSYRIEDWETL